MIKNFALCRRGLLVRIVFVLSVIYPWGVFAADNSASKTSALEQKHLKEKPVEELLPADIKPVIKKAPLQEIQLPLEADKEFSIEKITFTGNTAVANQDIAQIVAPFTDQKITLRKLMAIADQITSLYYSHGFVTSLAYIPPQTVDNNVVTIQIVEGKFGEVVVEDNKYFKKEIFKSYLDRFKGKIFNYNAILKEILYLNRHPDREVVGVVLPGKGTYESNLLLKVKDRLPVHAGFDYNNMGTRYTGLKRHALTVTHNNVTGRDDSMTLQARVSDIVDASKGFLFSYDLPLARLHEKKASLNVSFGYAAIELMKEYKPFEVKGKSLVGGVTYQQEIFDTLHLRGLVLGGFEAEHSASQVLGNKNSLDELRNFKAGLTVEEHDHLGRMTVSNELKAGIPDFLGASSVNNNSSSRAGAGGRFYKYSFNATRLNKCIGPTFLLMSLSGQYSPGKLTDLEQMAIGGAYTVRGYAEGEISGDYGLYESLELRAPAFFIPKQTSIFGRNIYDRVQTAFFVDSGAVYLKSGSSEDRETIVSGAGCGLRLNVSKHVYGKFDVAWPFDRRPSETHKNPHLYFSFAAGF